MYVCEYFGTSAQITPPWIKFRVGILTQIDIFPSLSFLAPFVHRPPSHPSSKREETSSSYFFFDVVKKREGPGNILFTVREGLTEKYTEGGFPQMVQIQVLTQISNKMIK